MTYEQALEIAMEKLYDAVEDLRYSDKGWRKDMKSQNRLMTAHYVLKDMQTKREWVGLNGLEQNELMAMNSRYAVFETEAKLKEKNA